MTLELLERLIDEDYGYSFAGNWGKSRDHSSLVVDRQKARWFWNSKNKSGTALDYLVIVRGFTKEQAEEFISKGASRVVASYKDNGQEVSMPYEKLVGFLWENGKGNREYWYHRGLVDSTIDRFRLGFHDGWYTIPIYKNGDFQNFQCRRDIPEKKMRPWYRGLGPMLFNSDILAFVSRVFITEGPVDAILLNQLGYPAVSHTAGAMGWKNEWFTNFFRQKEIVYVADNDEPGIAGALKVAKCLGESRVKILRFADKTPKYDTVDFFRDGGTTEEFEERLKTDLKYSYEGA